MTPQGHVHDLLPTRQVVGQKISFASISRKHSAAVSPRYTVNHLLVWRKYAEIESAEAGERHSRMPNDEVVLRPAAPCAVSNVEVEGLTAPFREHGHRVVERARILRPQFEESRELRREPRLRPPIDLLPELCRYGRSTHRAYPGTAAGCAVIHSGVSRRASMFGAADERHGVRAQCSRFPGRPDVVPIDAVDSRRNSTSTFQRKGERPPPLSLGSFVPFPAFVSGACDARPSRSARRGPAASRSAATASHNRAAGRTAHGSFVHVVLNVTAGRLTG